MIDRVDVAPDGAIRIVDYKTGNAVSEMFEGKVLFQTQVLRAGAVAHPRRGAEDAAG
ncbi:PD-(D/E)XK nuclease family protein [Nocardioides convexus]|uniref:PD-(D/E)XK nuclease family protein n=1 Tax=Nocardioides convexus TaxID=2712224 RepID=UPI00241854F7|nr:PD-(D/E)XK nuclease family protein [Nocardioides convexus]